MACVMAALAAALGGCGAPARAASAPREAAPQAECGPTELPPPRVWRLTHVQLRNTLQALFGYVGPAAHALPADARLEGYANGADRLGVSPLLLDYYRKMADEVSTEAVRASGRLLPCPLAELARASCRGDLIRGLGLRAFRRPLSAAEEARLDAIYFKAAGPAPGDPALGLKMVIEAMLLSPNFLFRFELGDDARPGAISELGPYEIASALSYTLWDAPPDATLLELAASGQLREPATIAAQAARLLNDHVRASGALVTFVEQWLKIDALEGVGKDAAKFPLYTKDTARDLLESNRRLIADVLSGSDGSLRSLLLGTDAYLNGKTAKLYGVAVKGGELKRVALDRSQRRGILTQAAFLAARADADTTRPVDRGSFVREEILCQDVPPPPDEFKFDASKITEDMTAREKLSAHAKSEFCARCHALFDGIGFALERYDAVGQFRTKDRGKVIDPSGQLPLPGKPAIVFADFVELVDKLAVQPEPYDCFAQRTLAYTTGRRADQLRRCEKETLAQTFERSGYRIEALVQAIVTSPGFVRRRNPGPGEGLASAEADNE
jgi:hypothetical protein